MKRRQPHTARHTLHRAAAVVAAVLMALPALTASSYDVSYYFAKLAKVGNDNVIAIGDDYLQRDSMLPALAAYSVVISRYNSKAEEVDPGDVTHAYNCSGIIHFHMASYDRSYACFTNAMKTATQEELPSIYGNMASLYFIYSDYDTALKYVDKSFNMSLRQKDYEQLSSSLENVIAIYQAKGNVGKIKPYLERFLNVGNATNNLHWRHTRQIALGMQEMIKGNTDGAMACFLKTLDILLGKGDKKANTPTSLTQPIISTYGFLAMVCESKGDYAGAIGYTLKAQHLAARHGYLMEKMSAMKDLADYYQKTNQPHRALESSRHYIELKDSMLDSRTYGKIKDIEYSFKIDAYEKEMTQLAQQRARRTRLLVVAAFFFVVLAVLLIVVVKKNKSLNERNRQLYLRNRESLDSLDEQKRMLSRLVQLSRQHDETGKHEARDGVDSNEKYSTSHLVDDDKKDRLMLSIQQIMEDTKVISDEAFSLDRLSQLVDSNPKYVSQVINERMKCNFATYLGRMRIQEICKRITDTEHYGNITMEAIAQDVGISSYSTFYRLFKKVTGLTPSQYVHISRGGEA